MKFYPALLLIAVLCMSISPLHAAQLNTSSTLSDTEAASSVAAPETKFDPVIDDLPLLPGLYPLPNEATIFVEPHAGRIAESDTQGMVDIDDVYRFYRHTLPHLGWQIIDSRTYHRTGEKLRIDAHADGKITTVRFSIRPE